MSIDVGAFFFIITLAGVINGLGIVEWIAGVGRFLKHSRTLTIERATIVVEYRPASMELVRESWA